MFIIITTDFLVTEKRTNVMWHLHDFRFSVSYGENWIMNASDAFMDKSKAIAGKSIYI